MHFKPFLAILDHVFFQLKKIENFPPFLLKIKTQDQYLQIDTP